MKVHRKDSTIHMSAAETKKWEDAGSAGMTFRNNIRDIAESMVRVSGQPVIIYAAESEGGWTADQIGPDGY